MALPEPDIGDDLWVRRDGGADVVHRAQLKSRFSWSGTGLLRYTINENAQRFEKRLTQPFLYFFGLLLPPDKRTFKVGCFPSPFFASYWRRGEKEMRIVQKEGRARAMLDFYLSADAKKVFFH